MAVIAFSKAIGPVKIDCVISEKPTAELAITEIPVESGAKITDHAIVLPKKVSLDIATGNVAASYAALVRFQETRVPFRLVTGLAMFSNMLIKSISPERDKDFSTVLRCRIDLQEIIIVETSYASDPDGDATGKRGATGGKKSTRAAPPASKDATTADRAAGTTKMGTTGGTTVPPSSIAYEALHGVP